MALESFKQSPMLHHEKYAEEVHKENLRMIVPFTICGFVLAFAVLLSRAVVGSPALVFVSAVMLAYYAVVACCIPLLRRVPERYSTMCMYGLTLPTLILALISSTVLCPADQGITFLLMLIICPLFVLDRPWRQLGYICTFTVLFVVASWVCKPYSIFCIDALHAIEFCLASMAITLLILMVRYSNVDSYLSTKNLSEHHDLTGLRNRRAFMANIGSYDGQVLSVAMVDLDDFKFFNDTYGHKMGDAVIAAFGAALRDAFGEDSCFNYGGDEFLIAAPIGDEERFLECVKQCREAMAHVRIEGHDFSTRFSCGYVFGRTTNRATTLEMTTYADANLYRAKNGGRNQSVGGAYLSSEDLAASSDDMSRMAGGRDIDPISGLPLLVRFVDQAQKYINNVEDGVSHAVVYLDVEDLKGLNQEHGYDTGDKLLKYLAEKISARFEGCLVGTEGGGTFYVLACDDDSLEGRISGAHDDAQNFPLVNKIYLKAGVYTCEPGVGMSLACDNARLACQDLERDRSTFWRRFDQHIEDKLKKRLYVIRNFTTALEQGWAHAVYQPIYDVSTGQLYGYEALGRWVDPTYGELAPADFVPLLEEYRLIGEFNLHLVRQVCERFSAMRREGRRVVPVSMNTSLSTFGLKDMGAEITSLLDEYELPHDLLIVEITEKVFGDNPGVVRKQMEDLRAAGVQVWLDDFGTASSSMSSLMAMDVDLVKVNAAVLGDPIDPQARGTKIVVGMKAILDDLGIEVLAEGVSTASQRDFLKELGITKMQRAF